MKFEWNNLLGNRKEETGIISPIWLQPMVKWKIWKKNESLRYRKSLTVKLKEMKQKIQIDSIITKTRFAFSFFIFLMTFFQ